MTMKAENKEKPLRTLDVNIPINHPHPEQISNFFEAAIQILRGNNPTWRIEEDLASRTLHIVMTSEVPL